MHLSEILGEVRETKSKVNMLCVEKAASEANSPSIVPIGATVVDDTSPIPAPTNESPPPPPNVR